jgi:hypothetical protein
MKTLITIAIILMVVGIATAGISATTTGLAIAKHKEKDPNSDAFVRGAKDAKDSCQHKDGCHWYILGKDKGFGYHSEKFNHNYVKGFCAANGGSSGSDADEATFDCPN